MRGVGERGALRTNPKVLPFARLRGTNFMGHLNTDRQTHETPINLRFVYLGTLPFMEAREIQEKMGEERRQGSRGDTILFCEHPPTISLGKRAREDEIWLTSAQRAESGIQQVVSDRGGGVTFHGPGQLLIYPVISLRALRMGAKDFVVMGLLSIVEVASRFNVSSVMSLNPAGVWVEKHQERSTSERREDEQREAWSQRAEKLAAVGLRIFQGVTNHGFSVNVKGELEVFSRFAPCGMPGLQVTSLAKKRGDEFVSLEMFAQAFESAFSCHLELLRKESFDSWHFRR